MALTEEEKAKIVEEEKLRAELQKELNPTVNHTNGIIAVVLGVLSFLLGLIGVALAPVGLYLGFKSKNKDKSPWGWPGIILNALFVLYILVALAMGAVSYSMISDIQEEDALAPVAPQAVQVKATPNTEAKEPLNTYDKYNSVNSVGQSILSLQGVDEAIQVKAWNQSRLKNEFLGSFPDFDSMRELVQSRIESDYLSKKLLVQITQVEDKFFSGSIPAEEAKKKLKTLK